MGQNPISKDSSDSKLISVARKIMTSAPNCALITLDKDGRARARAMDPFHPEKDLTVWFGTNSKSRKVSQIKNDKRVSLYYINPESTGYVMIYGIAELIDDPLEKGKRWKDEWEAFYPNKSDDFLLIKVIPQILEVISEIDGITGDILTWEPPRVKFDTKK